MPKRQSAGAGGSTLLGIEERRASAGGGSTALDRWLARRILAEAGRPPVAIELWDGTSIEPPSPGGAAAADLVARVEIRDRRTLYGLLVNSDVAFGDAVSADRIRVRGDLVAFLETIYRSTDDALPRDSRKRRFKAWINRPRRNTRAGSRSNVHHHYDLGNDFYRLWLDEEMVYTCAYYPHESATLEEAQRAKMDHVCRKLQLRPGQRVVEAGCGWGSLAIHMAHGYGAQVRAFNISREQVRFARERAAALGLAGAGLIAVAVWQAASLEVGLYVSGGFAAVAAALHLIGRGLVRAAAPLERAPWFALRHAALSLSRPGNQTRVILLAVGLGSFFIIGVRAMQTNLLGNFDRELRDDAPDMFLIDIQQDQADGVRAVLASAAGEAPQLIPVLRARITGVAGRRVSFDSPSGARRAGLGREYTVTYRASLAENERVVAGRFWDDVPAAEPEISIEENLRDEQGLELGDTIRFDVLGRQIAARVTSVREVRWDDTRSGGFMFLFRPGSFGDAPHTYIAFLQGPAGGAARARLQRDVVARYPNVSVIDGLAVLDTVRRVLEYVTLAISVVGGVALFSGGLILVGAVAMTRFQRIHEAAIFRTLGANARLLALMLVLEYGVLGILAGGVGSLGALILTWALARHVFEIAWFPSLLANVSGVFVTAAVVGGVGVAASVDVLRRKPLATLRAE